MVYVASDGSIHESQPWNMKKIVDTFWGFLDSVGLFVQTLLPFHFEMPRLTNRPNRSSHSARRNNFDVGRGSGGPSNNRPGGGGFRTMSDILPPPPTSACGGGGCAGGSCGR